MDSHHQPPHSGSVSVESPAGKCLQQSRLAVGSLICVVGGVSFDPLTWIFANQAVNIARGIWNRASDLHIITSSTSNPGQVPVLAESYGQYQQALAISTVCFWIGGALVITGLILARMAGVRVRQKRVSDPNHLALVAGLLGIVGLGVGYFLFRGVLAAWISFLFWGWSMY
jgi:hypothetical protein